MIAPIGWSAAVAPHVVLRKTRRGDREVEASAPDVASWRGSTPVLVDDIVSTAQTMIETVRHFARTGAPAPVATCNTPRRHGRTVADFAARTGKNTQVNSAPPGSVAVGITAAFVTALLVVRWVLAAIGRMGFTPFGWHRITLGSAALVWLAL